MVQAAKFISLVSMTRVMHPFCMEQYGAGVLFAITHSADLTVVFGG